MNKHFAILPDGTKITRNSANRTYTHVVAVGPTPKADLIVRKLAHIKMLDRNLTFLDATRKYLVEGGRLALDNLNDFFPQWRMTDLKPANGEGSSLRDMRDGKSIYGNREELITMSESEVRDWTIADTQRRYENLLDEIQAAKAAITKIQNGPDFVGNWGYLGWCGRLDLAQKLANRSVVGTCEVRIMEAEVA